MCWCIWDQKVNFSLETEMFFWDQNMNFLGDRIWCFWVRERSFWIGIRECQFWWSGEAKCLAGVLSEREGLRIKNSVGIVRALAWRNIYIREIVNFKVACISCMARLGEGAGQTLLWSLSLLATEPVGWKCDRENARWRVRIERWVGFLFSSGAY